MFDFLNRLGGVRHPASPQQSDGEAPSGHLRHYQPERHYMRGPGPAWRAAHPSERAAKGEPAAGKADKPA